MVFVITLLKNPVDNVSWIHIERYFNDVTYDKIYDITEETREKQPLKQWSEGGFNFHMWTSQYRNVSFMYCWH